MTEFDYDKLMQRIGEFVVTFQWLESRFRDTGWLIDDPDRVNWPPTTLRKMSNEDLLDTVATKYCDLMETLNIDDADDRKSAFNELVAKCHDIRKYRNDLLHSAFIQLKAGRDVVGIVRSNPKFKLDATTGERFLDQEHLTEGAVTTKIEELGESAVALNMAYMQLVHWAPFTQLQSTA